MYYTDTDYGASESESENCRWLDPGPPSRVFVGNSFLRIVHHSAAQCCLSP